MCLFYGEEGGGDLKGGGDYRFQLAQDRIQFQVSLNLGMKIVILNKARYSITSHASPKLMRFLKNSIGNEIFYLQI
jgi:hypothetical protein